MSVGVLLVAHGKLGHFLLETMADMIGPLPLSADVLEVRRVQDTNVLLRQGGRMIARLDQGQGVLILTDAYGSTPSNIATRLHVEGKTAVVAGINLPMLVRIFNYPALNLAELTAAAVEGGQRGVVVCNATGAAPAAAPGASAGDNKSSSITPAAAPGASAGDNKSSSITPAATKPGVAK